MSWMGFSAKERRDRRIMRKGFSVFDQSDYLASVTRCSRGVTLS